MEVLFEAVGRPTKNQPSAHSSSHVVDHGALELLQLQVQDLEFKVDVLQNAKTHDLRDDLNTHGERLLTANKKIDRVLANQSNHDMQLADFEARLKLFAATVGQPQSQIAEGWPQKLPQIILPPDGNMQSSAASGTADEKFEELEAKMAEVTQALREINEVRTNVEHEVDRLRRTVLLAVDREGQEKNDDDDGPKKIHPTLKHKSSNTGSERNTWHQRLPNFYKAINADNTGFDATHAFLEKRITILTGIATVLCLILMMMYFSSHTFTESVEVHFPTFSDYIDIVSLDNLMGKPECACEFPIMTWGNETGFVSGVTYGLDSWCIPRRAEQKYSIMYEPQENYQAGPGKGKIVGVEISRRGVNQFHSDSDLVVASVLGAYVTHIFENVRNWLDAVLCPVAEDILNKSLSNYFQQFYVSDSLFPQDMLIKTVTQEIMALAYNAGLVFEAGFMTEAEIGFMDSDEGKFFSLLTALDGGLEQFDQPCLRVSPKPCVLDQGVGAGTHLVQCCSLQDTFKVQCWMKDEAGEKKPSQGKETCIVPPGMPVLQGTCKVFEIPCLEPLKDLALRFNGTEYRDIGDGVKAAMLSGMSSESGAERATSMRASGPAPKIKPGSRRLQGPTVTENVGYLWTYSAYETFERYYNLCKPLECKYVLTRDKVYGLFLVFIGMVGGVTAGFRFGCGLLAGVSRKVATMKAEGRVDAASIIN